MYRREINHHRQAVRAARRRLRLAWALAAAIGSIGVFGSISLAQMKDHGQSSPTTAAPRRSPSVGISFLTPEASVTPNGSSTGSQPADRQSTSPVPPTKFAESGADLQFPPMLAGNAITPRAESSTAAPPGIKMEMRPLTSTANPIARMTISDQSTPPANHLAATPTASLPPSPARHGVAANPAPVVDHGPSPNIPAFPAGPGAMPPVPVKVATSAGQAMEAVAKNAAVPLPHPDSSVSPRSTLPSTRPSPAIPQIASLAAESGPAATLPESRLATEASTTPEATRPTANSKPVQIVRLPGMTLSGQPAPLSTVQPSPLGPPPAEAMVRNDPSLPISLPAKSSVPPLATAAPVAATAALPTKPAESQPAGAAATRERLADSPAGTTASPSSLAAVTQPPPPAIPEKMAKVSAPPAASPAATKMVEPLTLPALPVPAQTAANRPLPSTAGTGPTSEPAVTVAAKDASRQPTVVALPVSAVNSLPVQRTLASSASQPLAASVPPTPGVPTPTSPQPSQPVATAPVTTDVRELEVMHRDAQVLEISFPVARIEVDDETICKVLATESTNLLVLGIAKGTTILTVWPQSGSLDLPPQRYRVSVRDAWSEDAADMRNRNLLDEAQASLLELFPDSALTLRSHTNGSLSVLGKAQSNDQAKQIIQLVRKMFLVPVIDRIAVTTP